MSHTQPHTDAAKAKMRLAKLGKHLSPATEFKKGRKNPHEAKRIENLARGERNNKWKGDRVGYNALHAWVGRQLGKPKECSNCGFTSDNGRQFHWANISGKYFRDLSDWERLCASCHFKKDDILRRSWETRHALLANR